MKSLTTYLALILLLCATVSSASTLRRDPFRPPADFLNAPAASSNGVVTSNGQPEIRGILSSGGESLVNLDGQIIGIGEEAGGYRLLEVGETHAIFQVGDEIVTLELYPDEENAENDN